MICTGVASDRLAWAADPDFSSVTDILSGQRHLLRDDDLLIVSSACRSFAQGCATSPAWLFTGDSQITSTQQVAFPVWGPPNDGSAPVSATNVAAAVGRMFALPYDISATIGTVAQPNNVCPCSVAVEIEDPVHITGFEAIVPTSLPFAGVDFATMADFTGDGYADLFIHNAAGGMRIATATDVNNLSAGLTWGPELTGVLPNADLGAIAFAVGDFRGDGQRQIAVAINPPDFTGVVLTLYTVDPSSLTIAQATSVTLPIPDASEIIAPALATGRFGTTLHDQLVLTYSSPGVGVTSKVVAIDVDATLQPTVQGTLDLKIANGNTPFVGSGRLNWFGQFDQAVVAVPGGALSVVAFDDSLNITLKGATDISSLGQCLAGLVVGISITCR
jgi:hypothetical protein